jgi:drug/metabolite transporter (DMT)-like permease
LLRRYSPPVLAQLFWAVNFVVADRVVAEFTPLELTFLRWLGAFPLLLVIAIWLERADRQKWRTALSEWWLHLIQAALGMVGYTLFLYSALDTTSPVTASVITAINPAVIALAAVIFLGERIRRMGVLGIVISFVGVLIVVLAAGPGAGGGSGIAVAPGDLLVLGAITVWTMYVIISRRIRTPPITATTVQVGLSVVMLLPVMAFVGIQATPSTEGVIGLVVIMIFPSALAYLLWNIAVTQLGPSRTGVFLNLLPLFTAAIALTLGDVITIWQILGGAIVLAGVYLTTRPGSTVVPLVAPIVSDDPADATSGSADEPPARE